MLLGLEINKSECLLPAIQMVEFLKRSICYNHEGFWGEDVTALNSFENSLKFALENVIRYGDTRVPGTYYLTQGNRGQ